MSIEEKAREKKKLYKVSSNGSMEKVPWEDLPYWEKREIEEEREIFNIFLQIFPIMIICIVIIFTFAIALS